MREMKDSPRARRKEATERGGEAGEKEQRGLRQGEEGGSSG